MIRYRFLRKCEELGVAYEQSDFAHSIEAPDGFVFAGGGEHYADFISDGSFTMAEIYDELNEYLTDGVVECNEVDCEICTNK